MNLFRAVLGLALISQVGYAGETPDVVVHKRLSAIAGPGAIDCGRATRKEQFEVHTACATKAFGDRKPFFVQFEVMDVDALYENGLALSKDGHLFEVSKLVQEAMHRGPLKTELDVHACKNDSFQVGSAGALSCDGF
jgi:hypothetical protein